jgi:hypothetical protein
MFIAALFTIAKLWKQPRCPTTDEWFKKIWYLYTVEFYSTIKKNEIMLFAGKWMELEIVRKTPHTTHKGGSREVSHVQKFNKWGGRLVGGWPREDGAAANLGQAWLL